MGLHRMRTDLPTQTQPGDREEADQREAFALELATHIRRHPARHIPLRTRVQTLACVSDAELDRLVCDVDFFIGIAEWDRRQ
jgi:hypothetical protein